MVKYNFFISLIILCVLSKNVLSQETRLKYLELEGSMTLIDGTIANSNLIRSDAPGPYSYNISQNTYSSIFNYSFGIKHEIFSNNNKFGFLAGIRLNILNSTIGNGSGYFYVITKQTGLNTEYLKVREFSQNSFYLGIPLEIQFLPFHTPKFKMYGKLGGEVNILVRNNNEVAFYDVTMNAFKNEVNFYFINPHTFYTVFYLGSGIRLGRLTKPGVSFEWFVPFYISNSKTFGLINPNGGGGFRINFQLPYQSNKK